MNKVTDFFKMVLESLVIAVILVYVLTEYIVFPVEVFGTSMYPNLVEGEKGFSFIITRKIKLERFDIVVIDDDSTDYYIVKRVIGLPGEKVEYIDSKLYIDGEYVEEDFLSDSVVTNDFAMELNENEYCCLGDNREVSRDSRYYGAFSGEEIITNHIFIYSPTSSLGYQK